MIFVNFGGGNYYIFNHSPWNGITFADLCFPWFIWIMGASMSLSLDKKRENQTKDIISRSIKLFFLGIIIVNNAFDLEKLRIPGVL